jgi:hypothetical protein
MCELTFREQQAVKDTLRRTFANIAARLARTERMVVAHVKQAVAAGVGAEVARVMAKHEPDAPDEGPHAGWLLEDGTAVHHEHHPEADREHLDRVREDLKAIPGVLRVSRGAHRPAGPGWSKVYEMPPATSEEVPPPAVRDTTPPVSDMGDEKWFGPWRVKSRRPAYTKSLDAPASRVCCATRACGDRVLRGRCRCSCS